MKRWVYGAALALIAALPGFSMVRIAIFIGNNIGLSDEKPLH